MESVREFLEEFVREYGYFAIFLISFTESIAQPVPPDPFIAGATAFGMNPLAASITATLGSVLGGVVAYLLGKYLGEPVAVRLLGRDRFLRAEALYGRYGVWAVIIAAVTPVPYKVFCWLSGILELGLFRFVLASLIGRFPRFLAVAVLGDLSGGLFEW
ncbi:MAG: DedA family protein [Aquificae bacterium]|nr:DedA family protein [Aquificota bacterium]